MTSMHLVVVPMPMDKQCVAKGCDGVPAFGFGSLLNGEPRFACRAHLAMIWADNPFGAEGATACAPEEAGRAVPITPRPASPVHASSQGRLL